MRFWEDNWLCGPGSYFHGPFGMLINLAFWLGLILLVVWLFRAFSTNNSQASASSSTALETLKLRYAAGEINFEEFEQIRKNLHKS